MSQEPSTINLTLYAPPPFGAVMMAAYIKPSSGQRTSTCWPITNTLIDVNTLINHFNDSNEKKKLLLRFVNRACLIVCQFNVISIFMLRILKIKKLSLKLLCQHQCNFSFYVELV